MVPSDVTFSDLAMSDPDHTASNSFGRGISTLDLHVS